MSTHPQGSAPSQGLERTNLQEARSARPQETGTHPQETHTEGSKSTHPQGSAHSHGHGSKRTNLQEARSAADDSHSDCQSSFEQKKHHISVIQNETLYAVDPLTNYTLSLTTSRQIFQLSSGSHFALQECDHIGNLVNKYVIIEKIDKQLREGSIMVPACSCARSTVQKKRIKETKLDLCLPQALKWRDREVEKSCIHTKAFMVLLPTLDVSDRLDICDDMEMSEDNSDMIDQLNLDPFLVAVYVANERDYGIIEKARSTARRKYKCLTCTSETFICSHVSVYEQWLLNEGMENDYDGFVNDLLQGNPSSESLGTDEFECITTEKYPYPHTTQMAETFSMIENRFIDFPSCLVPSQPECRCMHGNEFNDSNPVEQGWLLNDEATIYTKYRKVPVTVYYRPTNECDCRYYYQGTRDLLLNIDNKTLVYMPYKIEYLHDCVEGKMPVAAHIRSVKRTAFNLAGTNYDTVPYKLFSKAFNAAIR